MKSRAVRRHHTERMKERARKYYGGVFKDDARHTGKIARTRTLCSCWMCGNPRKYLGELTMQERRRQQSAHAEDLSSERQNNECEY